MKRLESNQTEQSWFCCPLLLQEFIAGDNEQIYDSIHVDQVNWKQYIRNIVKLLPLKSRRVHLKTYKQNKKTVWMRLPMLREIFLGIFNRPLSCKGPESQRLFLFQLNSASGNGLQFRSI